MIISSMYKRIVPSAPDLYSVTYELQQLWDQLDKTHRDLEQLAMHFDSVIDSYKAPMKDLHEANAVLHSRIDELESELYGDTVVG